MQGGYHFLTRKKPHRTESAPAGDWTCGRGKFVERL